MGEIIFFFLVFEYEFSSSDLRIFLGIEHVPQGEHVRTLQGPVKLNGYNLAAEQCQDTVPKKLDELC